MSHAAEIRVLVILHFGGWDGQSQTGLGLGHLSPSEARQFVELLATMYQYIKYNNQSWQVVSSSIWIEAGLPILRIMLEEVQDAN